MEDDENWKAEGAEHKRKEKREAAFWNVLSYVAQAAFWLWILYIITFKPSVTGNDEPIRDRIISDLVIICFACFLMWLRRRPKR